MNKEAEQTLDTQIADIDRAIENTLASLYLLTEQHKALCERRDALLRLKTVMSQSLPVPISPDKAGDENRDA